MVVRWQRIPEIGVAKLALLVHLAEANAEPTRDDPMNGPQATRTLLVLLGEGQKRLHHLQSAIAVLVPPTP
ncbi:hypothetical protein BO86DRAFT_393132 [Aspergillus japonicus CBS 114.51]|uniref:Uncharacterized protein n=1 Tax=Aspergillus japonicus CBS 114.51 TaxID=1448312 RepID=A0A8T8WME8_ASPJA|nr:hypothetical protein BO86DRAFT_393132 [Aspergillus japonicus CBS 114.51]RAH76812.1 hypothetical protein BO86DRAFT_393132 [Aspergillus japonicus CBS 114.51]